MSFAETTLLGAVAGFTIFLGLPVARVGRLGPKARVALAMFAVGILAFLFADVLEHAFEIVEEAVENFKDDEGSLGHAVALTAMLGAGFTAGCAGIAVFESRVRPPARESSPLRTGMTIAAAIGLHNFAEGLAIGVAASTGEISLATVLIIGFALHNATEGFGIVGPLGAVRPTWRWLLVAGLVGGGPTFVGAMIGYKVNSEPLELAFYAVAAGAILYVISEVWNGMRSQGFREFGLLMVSLGFLAGIVTDLVVAYGGG